LKVMEWNNCKGGSDKNISVIFVNIHSICRRWGWRFIGWSRTRLWGRTRKDNLSERRWNRKGWWMKDTTLSRQWISWRRFYWEGLMRVKRTRDLACWRGTWRGVGCASIIWSW
jgi:hypothetical protein